MNTTGYRVTYTLLAVALLTIIGASILFIPSGDPEQLPDAVERYAPQDGDIAINPVKVLIVVQPNYEVRFVIDGTTIPEDDVNAIIEIGRYQFEPGEGKAIERWTPGDHVVVATWIGGSAGTDAGTLVWTFTVQ
jgi:multidrug efflux pump subunit AcrA (membrane-fusion protein)